MIKLYLSLIMIILFSENLISQDKNWRELINTYTTRISQKGGSLTQSGNYFYRGVAYYKLGLRDSAILDLKESFKIDPQDFSFEYPNMLRKVLMERCLYYYSIKKFDLGIADCNELQKMDQSAMQMHKQSQFPGGFYQMQGNSENGIKRLALRSYGYMHSGQINEGMKDLLEALKINNNNSLLYMLRSSYLFNNGEYDQAIKDIRDAISWHPMLELGYSDIADSICTVGDLYVIKAYYNNRTGKYQEAIDALNEAIRNDPLNSYFFKCRAQVNFNKGNYEAASNDYITSLKFQPGNINTIISLINTYLASDKYDKANNYWVNNKNEINVYFKSNPDCISLKLYFEACIGKIFNEQYKDAIPILTKSIAAYKANCFETDSFATGNQYAHILAKTSSVYEKLGDYGKAIDYCNKTLTIDKNVQKAGPRLLELNAKQEQDKLKHTAPPELELLSPLVQRGSDEPDGLTFQDGKIFVKGKVISPVPVKTIKINGTIVTSVQQGGNFSAVIDKKSDQLIIEVVDANNNVTTRRLNLQKLVTTTDNNSKENISIPPIDLEKDKPVYYAVLIACSDYQGSEWKPLPTTIDDAKELKKVLVEKYHFNSKNILELYNKNYTEIVTALSSKIESMQENDNLVIFYAGHGTYTKKGNEVIGYWVPLQSDNPSVNYISNKKMDELVSGCLAKHILIISDACYSSAMRGGEDIITPKKFEYKFKSRQILTSGGFEKVPGESVFVKMILKGLLANNEKYLSVKGLYGIIFSGVKNQTENEPELNEFGKEGNEGGQFYFIKSTK